MERIAAAGMGYPDALSQLTYCSAEHKRYLTIDFMFTHHTQNGISD